jgi:hypothetical protein
MKDSANLKAYYAAVAWHPDDEAEKWNRDTRMIDAWNALTDKEKALVRGRQKRAKS